MREKDLNSPKAATQWGYRELIFFSLPSLAASLLEPLASFVDTVLVGRISTEWLAALAVASAIFNTITWVFNFLIHTSVQAVSSHDSSGERDLLWARIKMASLLSLVLGIVSSALLWWGREWWFALASVGKSYRADLESYYLVRALAQPLVLLGLTWLSILRGFSYVRATFLILLVSTLLNIGLSAFLLYGLGWGIEGAAYGTLIAQAIVFVSCFFLVLKKIEGALGLLLKSQATMSLWKSYGRDSLGMLLRSGSLSLAFFLSTKFASQLGTPVLAGHQVLLQLWLFSSFFIDGLAVSANILAARYHALKERESLLLVAKRLTHLAALVGFIFMLIYLLLGPKLVALFTTDPAVIAVIERSLWAVALSQVVMAVAYLYDGLLFGLARFFSLGLMMLGGVSFIALPCFVASQYCRGPVMIWCGLILLGVYRAVVARMIFKRAMW